MPALDLALGLRMVWRATDVIHALVFQPVGQIGRRCRTEPLSLSSRGLCATTACRSPRPPEPVFQRVGDTSAFIVVQSFQAMM
jgi:hypothetical protein